MTEALEPSALDRWQRNPAEFITQVMVNPETGKPFDLLPAELQFLGHAYKTRADGRLLYPEQLFGAPKKSGKTGFAAMHTLAMTLIYGGVDAEAYCVANDFEQAQGRVFQAIRRICERSPFLKREAVITASRITFPATGATITAIASDYAGAAGANPTISVFDELWGYTSERSRRLWDEMVVSPARKISCRATVTYAGFEGESQVLEELYKRGLAQPYLCPDLHAGDGLLMFWTHEPVAPWQTEEWLTDMRRTLRRNAYLRQIENRFVTTESNFIELDWWDACIDSNARMIVADPRLPIYVGLDASTKHDSTAIVAVTWDASLRKARLVWHRIWQPSPDEPLDFEATVERTILDLRERFALRHVRFDPFQLQASAQRLRGAGVRIDEFVQSVPNLTEASQNLYELIKSGNIVAYADADIRLAMSHAVAKESTRGWRIAKEKVAHKIDVVVALGMAALAAASEGSRPVVQPVFGVQGHNFAGLGWNGAGWVDRTGRPVSRDDARHPECRIANPQSAPSLVRHGIPKRPPGKFADGFGAGQTWSSFGRTAR